MKTLVCSSITLSLLTFLFVQPAFAGGGSSFGADNSLYQPLAEKAQQKRRETYKNRRSNASTFGNTEKTTKRKSPK